jgi:hypothetical protein
VQLVAAATLGIAQGDVVVRTHWTVLANTGERARLCSPSVDTTHHHRWMKPHTDHRADGRERE